MLDLPLAETQAANLVKTQQQLKPTQVIAITGGKGGIGKTNISVNLSLALADLNKKGLLFDADLGLSNVDVLLNINVHKNLNHVLSHCSSLSEVMIDGPKGIKLIPASSGINKMTNLSKLEYSGLIHAFNDLDGRFDELIIDTAAGISDDVIMFIQAANETIVVVCDEPTSITDAYALIKVLHKEHNQHRFHIITNMVSSFVEGHNLFNKLNKATERFLSLSLNFCGIVPFDALLRKSVQKQKAIVDAYPCSNASLALKRIAKNISRWPVREDANNNISFFSESMLKERYYE